MVNGWISTNDRFPKENDEVLIWDNGIIWIGWLVDGFWQLEHASYDEYDNDNVTHWQPLPAPPGSEEI